MFAKPNKKEVLQKMHLANRYFQQKWPDVGQPIVSPDKTRPSNIWTRAVYYEGLMELYKLDPYSNHFVLLHSWDINEDREMEIFHYLDALAGTEAGVKYKLHVISANKKESNYITAVQAQTVASMDCRLVKTEGLELQLSETLDEDIDVTITDMQGRELYNAPVKVQNGAAYLAFDSSTLPQQILLVSVRYNDVLISKRVFTH